MVIYKITNTVNNKFYIGKTTRTIKQRLAEHRANVNNKDFYFYNAIRKYGWENFIVEELAYCYDSSLLSLLEKEFISLLKPDYNLTAGGDGLLNPSSETRKKMSLSAKNKKISDAFRKKCAKRMQGNTISPGGKVKSYRITDPANNSFNIQNLAAFCRENNLNKAHMCSVAKGNRNNHRGYRVAIL